MLENHWFAEPLLDAWYLTGPTASGKTDVALDLAEKLNAEIVSVDSMAVYREMNIGTAKATAEQVSRVPHHLIDIVEPTVEYSVTQFVLDAHRIAEEIRSRDRQVLFVGGTPLYLKVLLRGMFFGPPADWDFREQVERDVERFGFGELKKRLEAVDPLSAFKIRDGDIRRAARALEVARATGKPLSHWQTQFERANKPGDCRVFVLGWERGDLHRRVETRVQRMFDRGLIDEVRSLLDRYQQLSRTAMQAVGYKEPMAYLKGEMSLPQTIEQVIFHTRQFVRRQEIWFRSLSEVRRIAIPSAHHLASAATTILTNAA
jgi:tRNA dimethylallyltransferase